jgi:mannosidase alpha-like ER degradation enhancer 3
MTGKVVVVQRGSCMFHEKARHAQRAGAVGVIVIGIFGGFWVSAGGCRMIGARVSDNHAGSTAENSPLFAMSGDNAGPDGVHIPVVFLFHTEGQRLMDKYQLHPTMVVRIGEKVANPAALFEEYLLHREHRRRHLPLAVSEWEFHFRTLTTYEISSPSEPLHRCERAKDRDANLLPPRLHHC